MLAVLLFDGGGFRPVRDLAVTLHDAEGPGHACRGTQGDNRRRRDLGVLVVVDALLHDHSRARFVRLEVPMGLVEGLPHPAEVGLAVRRARRTDRLTASAGHRN